MGRYELETSSFTGSITEMGWFRKLLTLEPAVVNSIVASVITLLALWGIDASQIATQIGDSALIIVAIVNIIFGFVTRSEVMPVAKVAAFFSPKTGKVESGLASSYVMSVDNDEPEC